MPSALIQLRGYPARLASAALFFFTIIMAALSCWAGGLLDQFGARLPLMIGPAIAALGIGVMGLTVANGSYWDSRCAPVAAALRKGQSPVSFNALE
jgi:hypothetical protein